MFDRVLVFLRPKVLILPAVAVVLAMSLFIGKASAGYDIDGTYVYSTTAGKTPLVFDDVYKPKKRSRRSYRKARTARKLKRSVRKSRRVKRSRRIKRTRSAKYRRVRNVRRKRVRTSSRRRYKRRHVANRRSYRGGSRNLRAILRRVKPKGLPYALAAAVITVESRWRVNARGGAGEYGLMQLMPATARSLGLRGNPYNPTNNMRAGTKYLYRCYRRAKGSVALTIGCYNRGPGNMYRWRNNRITRNYVAKVRRIMRRG